MNRIDEFAPMNGYAFGQTMSDSSVNQSIYEALRIVALYIRGDGDRDTVERALSYIQRHDPKLKSTINDLMGVLFIDEEYKTDEHIKAAKQYFGLVTRKIY